MTNKIYTFKPNYVSPPGDTLQETIEAIGMSQKELALRMGKAHKTINEIIKGKAPITPDTALQLERVLGVPASFWNNRERQYREALAQQEEQLLLQEHQAWLAEIPLEEMLHSGWVERKDDPVQQLRAVLSFFGIASPIQWHVYLDSLRMAFRATAGLLDTSPGIVSAWLRKGELTATQVDCEPFNEQKFRESLKRIRANTVKTAEESAHEAIDLCQGSGVALVFIPGPNSMLAKGATRWMSPIKALIQLNTYNKTDDQVWFTFFHEAAHLLLHGKREGFVDGLTGETMKEIDADHFAMDFLIPKDEYHRITELPLNERSIRAFADSIGIAPSLVVGRLQFDKRLSPEEYNQLKRLFLLHTDDRQGSR